MGLVAGAVLVGAAVLVVGLILYRPMGTATTPGGVPVVCDGVDSVACAEWANAVLAEGPGLRTFDPEALERVRLSHTFLGIFGDCQAEYFLGRFQDEAAARETVACLDE